MKTRLIPSLDGGLYQYDGDSIEAVPLTAETLLSSSFKMTEDITMIGGKDILSYGIDPVSGQVWESHHLDEYFLIYIVLILDTQTIQGNIFFCFLDEFYLFI